MKRKVRVGSRDSVLAVRQAQILIETVKANHPEIELELITIKTTGDKILDKSLDEIGGKGLFIKELEQALIDSDIDVAVHSYKDMPYEDTDGLPIVALSTRESPYDALVLPDGVATPEKSKPVGSCSLRRTIQFQQLFAGYETKPVRGNVHTRLSKLDKGDYSALILAEAGLNRLGLRGRISRVFTADEIMPSGSQGILAVQGRRGEGHTFLDCFHDLDSETVSRAERQYLKALDSDCSSPVAVYGLLHKTELLLSGMYVDGNGRIHKGKITGAAFEAELLGETLAKQLKAKGGDE